MTKILGLGIYGRGDISGYRVCCMDIPIVSYVYGNYIFCNFFLTNTSTNSGKSQKIIKVGKLTCVWGGVVTRRGAVSSYGIYPTVEPVKNLSQYWNITKEKNIQVAHLLQGVIYVRFKVSYMTQTMTSSFSILIMVHVNMGNINNFKPKFKQQLNEIIYSGLVLHNDISTPSN